MNQSWWKSLWAPPKPSALIEKYLDGKKDSRALDEPFDGWVSFGKDEERWLGRLGAVSEKHAANPFAYKGLYTEEAKPDLRRIVEELRKEGL
jgi:hypothetical protein